MWTVITSEHWPSQWQHIQHWSAVDAPPTTHMRLIIMIMTINWYNAVCCHGHRDALFWMQYQASGRLYEARSLPSSNGTCQPVADCCTTMLYRLGYYNAIHWVTMTDWCKLKTNLLQNTDILLLLCHDFTCMFISTSSQTAGNCSVANITRKIFCNSQFLATGRMKTALHNNRPTES